MTYRCLCYFILAIFLAACAGEVTDTPQPTAGRITATLAPTRAIATSSAASPTPLAPTVQPGIAIPSPDPTLPPALTTPSLPTATLMPLAPTPTPPGLVFPAAASFAIHQARLHPEQVVSDFSLLPHYVISATLTPPRLWGQMRLSLTNTGETALGDVVLRLYGNGQSMYTGSRMAASNPRVAGQVVQSQMEAAGTALRVFLPVPLEPGEQVKITLDFETEVAADSFRGYGIQQIAHGIGVFGSPFPLLALRDEGVWRVPAIPRVGDAASSPVALWDLFLEVSSDLTLVSSGETMEVTGTLNHVVTGPARDVALVTMAAGATPIELSVSGTQLRYWPATYVRGESFPARDAATVAAAAIQT
nr:hypothetical protein [Ardenticatenales bacterium]